MERRVEAQTLLSLAATRTEINDEIERRAQALVGFGYSSFDALHIATAESAGADVMLTTDDKLLTSLLGS
jgi:predicted nucleic acid-binding protein